MNFIEFYYWWLKTLARTLRAALELVMPVIQFCIIAFLPAVVSAVLIEQWKLKGLLVTIIMFLFVFFPLSMYLMIKWNEGGGNTV